MSAISLRESWHSKYGSLNLSHGIWANTHPFYTQISDSLGEASLQQRRQAFPYKSLRSLTSSLESAKGFVPTQITPHDYPSNASPGWTDKLNGVTHDDQYWYFAQQERLWKVPVTHDLNTGFEDSFLRTEIPLKDYKHFGDIDFYQGLIYVPIEGHHDDFQLPAVVAIFDQDLQFKGAAQLSAQRASGPWCAINPLNGLLYSSIFNDDPDRIHLQIYERSFSAGFELKHIGTMELFNEEGQPLVLGGLQGAAFSKQGHFYLVIDTVLNSADDPSQRGIMGFDMITGRRIVHTLVDYQPWKYFEVVKQLEPKTKGWVKTQELEGITIWEDADAAGAAGISGQLHLIMLDKDLHNDDDLYFKHYAVANLEDIGKV